MSADPALPPTESARAMAGLIVAIAVAAAVGLLDTWVFGVMAGWVAGATVLLGWTWRDLAGATATFTRAVANREDPNRTITGLVLVSACVASLAAVGAGLHAAGSAGPGRQALLTATAVAAVALAWATVHTVFTIRYAHEYYTDDAGGIDFPGDAPPGYADFAYFAFGVGMTFQVSDAPVSSTTIRRTTLRHMLVSYLFGTAIIAASINVVAGLI